MEIAAIIEHVVEEGPLTLIAVMPSSKEGIRINLHRAFKRHCDSLDSVGYLPTELEGKTLRFKYDLPAQELTISVGDKRSKIEYLVKGVDDGDS